MRMSASLVQDRSHAPVGTGRFALSEAMREIMIRSTRTPEALRRLRELLGREPALEAEVLRIAATLAGAGLADLEQAFEEVGARPLVEILKTRAILRALLPEGLDEPRFWEQSILAALLARGIAERVPGEEPPDLLYTIGLLGLAGADLARGLGLDDEIRTSLAGLADPEAIAVVPGRPMSRPAIAAEALRFAAVLLEERHSRDLDALLRRDLDADAARLFQPIDLGALAREAFESLGRQLLLLGLPDQP